MPRKKITDLISELRSWIPNYDRGPQDYPTVLYRTLAALPGGDELEGMGYEPMGGLGWHEADQLGRVLVAIQDKRDVEDLAAALTADPENPEKINARKPIKKLIEELESWLANYDHGPDSYPTTFYRFLASAPGGDRLEDMGYEPIGNLGWQELDQLGRVLEAIQDKGDVEDLIAGLMSEEEEEGVGEMRESMRGTVHITSSQNLATLIDNAYGHLSSREASALMRAIDDAEREGEDPRRAAIGYLRQLGITVIDTPSTREAPRHVRKSRRDEQKHGSFVVVISDGTQQRFHELQPARDWGFQRLQPLPAGSTALFYRAQVGPGRSDTGAPWTEPFDGLEKNEHGRIVKLANWDRVPRTGAGPFAHEMYEAKGRLGRAIKADDGSVVGHAHPIPQTSLERTRWVVVLTGTGARSWDAGLGRHSGAREAIKDFANEQGNAVKVEYQGREVSKVYPDLDRFAPVSGGLRQPRRRR